MAESGLKTFAMIRSNRSFRVGTLSEAPTQGVCSLLPHLRRQGSSPNGKLGNAERDGSSGKSWIGLRSGSNADSIPDGSVEGSRRAAAGLGPPFNPYIGQWQRLEWSPVTRPVIFRCRCIDCSGHPCTYLFPSKRDNDVSSFRSVSVRAFVQKDCDAENLPS